jgi:hypothetical protein
MGFSLLHVSLAGVELVVSVKLPDSHIPCMDTSFIHELLDGVD